jgi:hypothetical protein
MPVQKFVPSNNMDKDVLVPGLEVLKAPKGWGFEVEVTFDSKIFKEVSQDSILIDEMNEAVKEIYDTTCKSIKSKYSAFEKQFQLMREKGVDKKLFEKNLDGFNKSLLEDKKIGEIAAKQAVEKVWKAYVAKKAEYAKYKIKIGVTIFAAAASFFISLGLMVSAPFTGGVGAAASIIGMWKSALTVGKEIASAAVSIEKAQNVLSKYMEVVEKIASKGKAAAKVNELGGAVAKQLLGEAQPTIKGCSSQLDTIKQKLTGVEANCHNSSKLLNKMLDEQKKLRDDYLTKAKKQLESRGIKDTSKFMSSIERNLDQALALEYKKVQAQIEKTMDIHQRFKKAEVLTKELEKRLTPLLKLRGLDNVILENLLYFADLPLSALDGNAFAKTSEALVRGMVPTAALTAFDKTSKLILTGTPLE